MINLNQCPEGEDFHSDITGGADEQQAATQTEGKADKKERRRRRTKAEIEADRKAASGETDSTLPAPPVPGSVAGHLERLPLPLEVIDGLLRQAVFRVRFGGQTYVISIQPESTDPTFGTIGNVD